MVTSAAISLATAATGEPILPAGFEDLLEFIPDWLGDTADERWDIRARHAMPEIQYFYDTLLARSEAILSHVEKFPLTALPSPSLRLYQLLLALAQAAMAIELHRRPRAPRSPYPHKIRILRGPMPIA
jgi:hypothetical protein